MKKRNLIILILAGVFCLGLLGGCGKKNAIDKNKNSLYSIKLGLNAPAKEIDVIRPDGSDNPEGVLSARILQGVINKKQPRVYLDEALAARGVDIASEHYKRLIEYGGVKANLLTLDTQKSHRSYAMFWTLFKEYKDEIEKIYIYDEDLPVSDSINVAAMLAGRNKGVAVNQELYDRLASEGYTAGKDIINVCKRYNFEISKGNFNINSWICDNMVKGSNRDFVFVLSTQPRDEFSKNHPMSYDLAVATDALIFHYLPDFESHKALQKKILNQFDNNTKVIGWAGDKLEGIYIQSICEANKEAVCADWGYPNGSLFASFPDFRFEELISPVPESYPVYDDKVYVSFLLSDGDAWQYATKELISYWNSPVRGNQPIGWTIPSLFAKFNPLLLKELYNTKTPNDDLIQGVTGVSYIQPKNVSDKTFTQFCYDTRNSLKNVGLSMINYWDMGSDAYTEDSKRIKELCEIAKPDALLMGHKEPTNAYFMVGDTVCISQMGAPELGRGTLTAEHIVKNVLDSDAAQPDRPTFVFLNVEAWGEGISTIQQAIEELTARSDGYRYEFVLPSQLVAAIRSYEKNGSEGNMPESGKVNMTAKSFEAVGSAEKDYLYEENGSGIGEKNRYADENSYFTYKFTLEKSADYCQISFAVENQFLVKVSTDNINWTTALTNKGVIGDPVYGVVDIKKLLPSFKDTVYVRFEDSVKTDGFGASVTKTTIRYK